MDRRERIRQYLQKNQIVMLKDLQQMFPHVSAMTIRRDLIYLEKLGEVERIRGGAKSTQRLDAVGEPIYSLRANENIEAKNKIAKAAVSFIKNDRSIYIDSGTTAMALAKIVPDIYLSVLTSGPNIALEIAKKFYPTVNLVGGVLNKDNLSLSGIQSTDFAKLFNIDLAFIVASAFSLRGGFSCGNYSECDLKHAIIKKSRKSIVMFDDTKVDKDLSFTFATLEDVDVIITNKKLPNEIEQQVLNKNIQLIYA